MTGTPGATLMLLLLPFTSLVTTSAGETSKLELAEGLFSEPGLLTALRARLLVIV